MTDPVTGPIDRATLKELADAPFGKAAEFIRKYDPQWGRAEGEKFRWKVTVRREDGGTAYVMAASQEEADEAADDLTESEIDWDFDGDAFVVETVEPDKTIIR
jgi:hypothetical protein